MAIARCIYCPTNFDPLRGEGDHVIPAALGRFKNELTFRGACPACNNAFGSSEEQLLRCAPEAVLRRVVNPPVKRHNRGNKWVGANGMPPPKFMVNHDGHNEIVAANPELPTQISPVDQLVITGPEIGERHLCLHPEMTAASLRSKIDELLEGKPSAQIRLLSDERNTQKYLAILSVLYPNTTFDEADGIEPGEHSVKGRIEMKYHDDYYRAIAKIGFHYYLKTTERSVCGDEPMFESIRNFIRYGGDFRPFFRASKATFCLPFGVSESGVAELPADWLHILACDEAGSHTTAMVCLFMGPTHPAIPHHINLGAAVKRLVVPQGQHSHVYLYDSGRDGFAGQVIETSLTQLRGDRTG